MTALALIVASYALVLFVTPQARPPFLHGRTGLMQLAVTLHLGGGGVALALGAFQLNAALRSRRIQLHRIMGRVYVVSVILAAVSGLADGRRVARRHNGARGIRVARVRLAVHDTFAGSCAFAPETTSIIARG